MRRQDFPPSRPSLCPSLSVINNVILSHLSGEPAWTTCFQLGSSEPDVWRPQRMLGTKNGKPGPEWEQRYGVISVGAISVAQVHTLVMCVCLG